jgi:hypothetical protein
LLALSYHGANSTVVSTAQNCQDATQSQVTARECTDTTNAVCLAKSDVVAATLDFVGGAAVTMYSSATDLLDIVSDVVVEKMGLGESDRKRFGYEASLVPLVLGFRLYFQVLPPVQLWDVPGGVVGSELRLFAYNKDQVPFKDEWQYLTVCPSGRCNHPDGRELVEQVVNQRALMILKVAFLSVPEQFLISVSEPVFEDGNTARFFLNASGDVPSSRIIQVLRSVAVGEALIDALLRRDDVMFASLAEVTMTSGKVPASGVPALGLLQTLQAAIDDREVTARIRITNGASAGMYLSATARNMSFSPMAEPPAGEAVFSTTTAPADGDQGRSVKVGVLSVVTFGVIVGVVGILLVAAILYVVYTKYRQKFQVTDRLKARPRAALNSPSMQLTIPGTEAPLLMDKLKISTKLSRPPHPTRAPRIRLEFVEAAVMANRLNGQNTTLPSAEERMRTIATEADMYQKSVAPLSLPTMPAHPQYAGVQLQPPPASHYAHSFQLPQRVMRPPQMMMQPPQMMMQPPQMMMQPPHYMVRPPQRQHPQMQPRYRMGQMEFGGNQSMSDQQQQWRFRDRGGRGGRGGRGSRGGGRRGRGGVGSGRGGAQMQQLRGAPYIPNPSERAQRMHAISRTAFGGSALAVDGNRSRVLDGRDSVADRVRVARQGGQGYWDGRRSATPLAALIEQDAMSDTTSASSHFYPAYVE